MTEILCCEWLPYPRPGESTVCGGCGSTFFVPADHADQADEFLAWIP